MAQAVGTTLGVRGRNVAIAKTNPYGQIYERLVLHDGVSVARSIDLPDEFENMGAQLLKQAAQKQVQDVGDGTTAVIILAQAIITEANKLIAAGINPMSLRSGLEAGSQQLVDWLEKAAIKIENFEQMKQIATISAEDAELGELVAQTVQKMGADGLVAVEQSKNSLTTVEEQTGLQFDKGFAHPLFMTNPERLEATLEDPYLLITDKPINNLEAFREILVAVSKQGYRLVIIAPTIGADALGALVKNKMDGAISCLAILAPSFGSNQQQTLQDIALATGAQFITEQAGHKFEDVELKDLGRAEYITATKGETLIVGGKGDKKILQTRVGEIKLRLEKEDQEFEKELLRQRLARLTSGIAVIRVGGATEVEMLERLERVKDSVLATKSAISGGIVPGGEVIYLQARKEIKNDILCKALYEPFRVLVTNAGFNDGQLYEKLENFVIPNKGIDVIDGEVKDMMQAGIVDPVAVPINAIINSVSVAIQLITTGCVIVTDIRYEKPVSQLPKTF